MAKKNDLPKTKIETTVAEIEKVVEGVVATTTESPTTEAITIPVEIPGPNEPIDMLALVQRLDRLERENQELKEAKNMLLEVADKTQLAGYYSRNEKKLPTEVKIKTIDGKIVIGTKTILDSVEKDPVTMRWTEKQIIEVLFSDGTSGQYYYADFSRRYVLKDAVVLQKMVDEETQSTTLKVRIKDTGEELVIGTTFIN